MCDQATKHSANQVQVNSSIWHLITTPESPGLMSTTDSELTMSPGGALPGKGDLSLSYREGGWIGQLYQASKVLCPSIWMECLDDSLMNSMKLSPTPTVGEAATWCTPSMGHGPSPGGYMPAKSILWMHVDFSFCLNTLYMTVWSNFLNNRINFIHWHRLLPCLQQRLLQVYGKMFIHTKVGIVMENLIVYNMFCGYYILFYFIPFILLYPDVMGNYVLRSYDVINLIMFWQM